MAKLLDSRPDNTWVRIAATSMTTELELALPPGTIWFAPRCCAVVRGQERDILVGGILVATVGPKDTALRNLLVAGLAEDPSIHLGQLARAFALVPESVRQIRRLYDAEGLPALLERRYRGKAPRKRAAVESRARKLFDAGRTVEEVHVSLKGKVGRSTVGRIRQDWAREKEGAGDAAEVKALHASSPMAELDLRCPGMETSESATREDSGSGSADAGAAEEARIRPRPPESAELVQHAGTWLLIATVHALGLHARANAAAAGRVSETALRLALDAVVAALALGERCVEGVRRLATSSAASLLLATRAPSAPWARGVLGRFAAEGGGATLQLGMARQYLLTAKADADAEGPVFYVDNHLRPYTGKHVVRKGWRMQDKRVRPGATDYYVHDEDGRPVMRFTIPQHGALTEFLSPICETMRLALPEETILVAFDRAGAFPAQLSKLRDADFEFVTYERRPYALLAESEFTEQLSLDDEKLRWCEPREKNLGGGRGRVRRICVRTEEGRQVNLLANSRRPAPRLIEVMRGRWTQENGFKHANERWGINQLDGRTVIPYSPETIVPNPARRRLDHALNIWRVREGQARSELARLTSEHPRRAKVEDELRQALAEQKRLEELRPSTPVRALLSETELAGKLVHHELEYKLALDSVRIACANAESELATLLAPLLPRAAEAKKMLANLFAAPGRVSVGERVIAVTLRPAANKRDTEALTTFLAHVNARMLTLPGDQKARRLRFKIHQVS